MFRHLVNLGLLFSFVTLAATGVLSFIEPFSLRTTRLHTLFGLLTVILVGLHLASRLRYFGKMLSPAKPATGDGKKRKPILPRSAIFVSAALWVALIWVAWIDATPVRTLINQSYEARHKAEILRLPARAAVEHLSNTTRLLHQQPNAPSPLIEFQIDYQQDLDTRPAVAIWAQTTRGAMVQTFFVDERLAYGGTVDFGGEQVPRHHVLPIWRHSYTLVNGIDPNNEIDAITGATPEHRFSLADHLNTDADDVVIYLELNAPNDPDSNWPDPTIGQPSILYSALVDLTSDQRYYIMTPLGHGGGAAQSGRIQYGTESLSTANGLIDKVLIKLTPPAPEATIDQSNTNTGS